MALRRIIRIERRRGCGVGKTEKGNNSSTEHCELLHGDPSAGGVEALHINIIIFRLLEKNKLLFRMLKYNIRALPEYDSAFSHKTIMRARTMLALL